MSLELDVLKVIQEITEPILEEIAKQMPVFENATKDQLYGYFFDRFWKALSEKNYGKEDYIDICSFLLAGINVQIADRIIMAKKIGNMKKKN